MKLGASFSDAIHTEKNMSLRFSRKSGKSDFSSHAMRGYLFLLFIGIGALILLGRLAFLQLLAGGYYRSISDTNRIRTALIHAPRGIIFDRDDKPLVFNVPGYRETVNGKTVLIDEKAALDKIAKGDKKLEVDSLRQYPIGEAAAHVVGYIGQISTEDLKDPLFAGYNAGDLVGKMGIEQSGETFLRGVDGKVLVEVDATGKPIRILGETDPIAGQNIFLTIDSSLQKEVANAMKTVKRGAAIVTTPTGEVLAMVSKPSFDPNLFTMGEHFDPPSDATYHTVEQVLLDGTGQPLLDRAISGTYPPGSTFKLVTATAALQTKTIDTSYTVEDDGILKVGDFSFANWYYTEYGRTEGPVDVVKAIKRSNDIFFYKVGQLLGVDTLSSFAQKYGLGKPLGISIEGEAKGLVPTKEWKEKVIGDKWYLGDDYHYGIGQGYLLTTPLQVNSWTATIANGGTVYAPRLLKNQNPVVKNKDFLSMDTLNTVREGMIESCDTGGVAWPFFGFAVKNSHLQIDGKDITEAPNATGSADASDMRHVVVACKTGTAQHGDDSTLPHAWITAFAPAYHPQIVVTVLSEESGEGSNVAGPIAKEIMQYYFENKY